MFSLHTQKMEIFLLTVAIGLLKNLNYFLLTKPFLVSMLFQIGEMWLPKYRSIVIQNCKNVRLLVDISGGKNIGSDQLEQSRFVHLECVNENFVNALKKYFLI